nr:hypothetical protein CFP56_27308 [Quercus suber]
MEAPDKVEYARIWPYWKKTIQGTRVTSSFGGKISGDVKHLGGVFKANVDGSFFNDLSSSGIGVVLWDDKGRVAGALSQKIYAALGPLGAEAKAMEATALFAGDMGIQDIEFEGDSLQVCNFLRGCSSIPPDVANVLEGILSQLQFFCSFVFSHIRKVGNKPAHLLAQHAKFVNDFEAWVEESPSFLEVVIASDATGCN